MTTLAGTSLLSPGPNLILNGSFENFAANTANFSGWTGLMALEGWSLGGTARANTNWFEPHANGYGGIKSADGRAMLDLGASPGNVTISQQLENLAVGATYRLTFSTSNPSSDNSVQVSFGGVQLGVATSNTKAWTNWTYDIVVTSASAALTFAEIGKVDNSGTYLDNVKLVKVSLSDAERETEANAKAEAERAAFEKAAEEQAAAEKLATEQAAREAAAKAEAERIEAEKAAALAAAQAEAEKVIKGTEGADELWGTKATKEILAGDGNDYIVAGLEGSKVDGGKGFNTLSYHGQGGDRGATVDAGRGIATNTFGFEDSFVNIQRVYGSDLNDKLFAGLTSMVLDGRDGADFLKSDAGQSLMFGGAGNDTLESSARMSRDMWASGDTMVGGQGNDALVNMHRGLATVDYSQDGGDRGVLVNVSILANEFAIDTWGSRDLLWNIGMIKGTDKADVMIGGSREIIIFDGGDGDDTLTAGTGGSEIYGAAGNDVLTGSKVSSSFLEGGLGDDTIYVSDGYTALGYYGGDGFDVVTGFKATDTLRVYNSSQSAEELVKAASYHEHTDGRDGLVFSYGDTKVFLAGVYELKAEQIQFMNV